jgi:hypothetical protein
MRVRRFTLSIALLPVIVACGDVTGTVNDLPIRTWTGTVIAGNDTIQVSGVAIDRGGHLQLASDGALLWGAFIDVLSAVPGTYPILAESDGRTTATAHLFYNGHYYRTNPTGTVTITDALYTPERKFSKGHFEATAERYWLDNQFYGRVTIKGRFHAAPW